MERLLHYTPPYRFGMVAVACDREIRIKYCIYKDIQGYWRWYLEAGNNRKIANSGEGYYNRADCLSAISLVKGSDLAPVYDLTNG